MFTCITMPQKKIFLKSNDTSWANGMRDIPLSMKHLSNLTQFTFTWWKQHFVHPVRVRVRKEEEKLRMKLEKRKMSHVKRWRKVTSGNRTLGKEQEQRKKEGIWRLRKTRSSSVVHWEENWLTWSRELLPSLTT